MSDAKLIAATKEYIPVRLDEVKDEWAWREYKVQGIGVFLVLNNKAEKHTEIPMQDVMPNAVINSFVKTLGRSWSELKSDVKRVTWQPSLDAAKALAAKSHKPIALLVVKVKVPKKGEQPSENGKQVQVDAKGAAALAALAERTLAPHYDRYVWVRVNWGKEKPEIAKTYGLSRAPALALIEADGKKVSARVTRFHPVKLPRTLAKIAKKAEAKAERERKRAERAKKR